MSHLVSIRTLVRDPVAIIAACARLQLPAPVHRTVRLFSAEVTGLAVELPGWRYPVICQTESGELKYDNYQGQWGEEAQLHRFQQAYAIEKAKLELRKQGQSPTEQLLADGSVRVRVVAAA